MALTYRCIKQTESVIRRLDQVQYCTGFVLMIWFHLLKRMVYSYLNTPLESED